MYTLRPVGGRCSAAAREFRCTLYGVTCWEVFSLGRSPYPGIENHEILPLEGDSANQLSIVTNCEIIASQLAILVL